MSQNIVIMATTWSLLAEDDTLCSIITMHETMWIPTGLVWDHQVKQLLSVNSLQFDSY